MKQLFRNRLSWRLTRNTVLLAMGVGLVLNLIQVFVEYHKTGEYMDRDINALMEISHSPASQIAYNIDTRLAGELLNGMVRHPAVIDARIIDPDGHTLSAATSNRVDSSHRWINDLLFGDFRRYETGLRVPDLKEMDLGYLAVTITPNHYGNLFLSRAGFILLSGIFKTLVLTAMLLVTFYWLVTKPILSVISSLQHVGSAPEKARLQTPNSHEEDEIGTLVDIINRHLETVDASIRQMRALKDEMKDYSSKLEREVEERTQEITEKNAALKRSNRALVRAKEEAVHRAQIRARFLASMSHEVRTPLNGVLGMLELVLESDLAPAQRQQLEIALRAGETLLSLLNDILDISKVEAGKLDLEVISFDLRALVSDCATIHREQARRKGLEFTTELDTELAPRYFGDPTRLRQVINNLLSNAIKFTGDGEISVHVTRIRGGVQLDIRDTGIGMSQTELERIFSPFSQAATDTARRFGGTGLGLALCRQLVERMQGQISVDSERNSGTLFRVSLPLPADLTDDHEPHLPSVAKTETESQHCKILLVEDNRVNQIVASGLLRKMGHEVDHAENGERALAALALKPYDLVLMDCQMPVMDGYEATRRIRENPEWSQLPVIAVTANVMSGDRNECLAAGMDDYITKPYNRETLNTVIQRWAAKGRTSTRPAQDG